MPPRKPRDREGEEVTSRPPTVKADDLRSMEVLDEEEGGWAGHHEEVDYSKVCVLYSECSVCPAVTAMVVVCGQCHYVCGPVWTCVELCV